MASQKVFTIYDNPSDFPGQIVVRRYTMVRLNDKVTMFPSFDVTTFPDVEAARLTLLLMGLTRLERHADDDVTIVENWI